MLGLTTLGIVHTAISLVAVGAGFVALIRDKQILPKTGVGKTYVWATVLTCLTGFGIFQHGGFAKPHVLGILTLIVMALAIDTGRSKRFGKRSQLVEMLAFSTTFFFHFIPGITETTTRLPIGAPLIADREGPELKAAVGVIFGVFVILAILQARWLQKRNAVTR